MWLKGYGFSICYLCGWLMRAWSLALGGLGLVTALMEVGAGSELWLGGSSVAYSLFSCETGMGFFVVNFGDGNYKGGAGGGGSSDWGQRVFHAR
ncbi:hypothetical protein V6N13_114204 [Hibiscus sabdariffa]|uniref:Secreted protein n=1 Tax=Hibiscus sabdariffa TaxID=183260 RepID=A0ABR2U131_9ROSI